MAELSKEIKLILVINAIPAFIYAFFFLVIPDTYVQMTEARFYNPATLRQLGASILILGLGNIVGIKRNDLDKVRLFWEMGIIWLILMVIIGIWSVFTLSRSATDIASSWIANIILIVLTILNIFIYYRATK